MNFRYLLYFIFILFATACSKETTELPPATQTGANTFGCKVDGVFWVPSGFGIIPTAPILEARMLPDNSLIITARNFSKSPTETEFEIRVKNVTSTGDYLLNTNTSHPNTGVSYAYYVHRRFNPLNEWITSSLYTGKVTITKVETGANAFVSGTFEFNAISIYNGTSVAQITEGRFDVKLP